LKLHRSPFGFNSSWKNCKSPCAKKKHRSELFLHSGLIQFRRDIAPLFLDVIQAVPCGLPINELLSNSLKHAFPRKGEVQVQPSCEESESAIRIRIADDGIGLPVNFEAKQPRSLGLRLVSDPTGQPGGRIDIVSDPGSAFTVAFKPQTGAITGVSL
jgi:two-component system, sensor histidine kinase PdtaS